MSDLERLNTVKNSLNRKDFDQLRNRSTFEVSVKNIRKQITEQYGCQNVTKAWLKMVDLLFQEIVWLSLSGKPVKAFFNAELPGGFVFSANHLFKTNGMAMNWVIASLYPQNQMGNFLGDSYGLLKGNPDHSLVGPLNTNKGQVWCNGDLTNPKMCDTLSQLAIKKIGPVNLYTADGGIGTDDNPNDQEMLNIPLIIGEARVGIKVLASGGVMILKMFTFFTPVMKNLIIWLGRHFGQYTLVKPAASSMLNSEIYFIGVQFKEFTEIPTEELLLVFNPTSQEQEFISTYQESFVTNQINTITNFLQGKSPSLDTWSYRRLSKIEKEQWLTVDLN